MHCTEEGIAIRTIYIPNISINVSKIELIFFLYISWLMSFGSAIERDKSKTFIWLKIAKLFIVINIMLMKKSLR